MSYTERLDNFIKRFSQEFNIDSSRKHELDASKKRFSMEDKDNKFSQCGCIRKDTLNNK